MATVAMTLPSCLDIDKTQLYQDAYILSKTNESGEQLYGLVLEAASGEKVLRSVTVTTPDDKSITLTGSLDGKSFGYSTPADEFSKTLPVRGTYFFNFETVSGDKYTHDNALLSTSIPAVEIKKASQTSGTITVEWNYMTEANKHVILLIDPNSGDLIYEHEMLDTFATSAYITAPTSTGYWYSMPSSGASCKLQVNSFLFVAGDYNDVQCRAIAEQNITINTSYWQ
jgi:hypothetical protein